MVGEGGAGEVIPGENGDVALSEGGVGLVLRFWKRVTRSVVKFETREEAERGLNWEVRFHHF